MSWSRRSRLGTGVRNASALPKVLRAVARRAFCVPSFSCRQQYAILRSRKAKGRENTIMERYCEGERFSDLSFTEEAFESCDFTDYVFVDCTFAKCDLDHLGKRHISQLFQLFNGRSGVLLFQIRSARQLTARAGERPLLSC